jgi:hypothetical protein
MSDRTGDPIVRHVSPGQTLALSPADPARQVEATLVSQVVPGQYSRGDSRTRRCRKIQ